MTETPDPTKASEYRPEWTQRTRELCLFVATKLDDLLVGDIVVIGGLVPGLLVDQANLPAGAEPHVGTMDLDLGLSLVLLDNERYREVSKRLRGAGFEPDVNEAGRIRRQKWVYYQDGVPIYIDFLIPPADQQPAGGRIQDLEGDFAAQMADGLDLAFKDRETRRLSGRTIQGERAQRTIPVCGPAAFVVLKAIAFRNRGEDKDAYDLYYVLRNYGNGPFDVAARLRPYLDHPEVQRALSILQEDFTNEEQVGVVRAVTFMERLEDPEERADVVGFVARFLKLVEET